jgi:ceramide glucosyltransferase
VSPGLWHLAAVGSAGVAAAGLVQSCLGLAAARGFLPKGAAGAVPDAALPRVSVLKPLHGAEPMLADALESFFRQDYPGMQLVFGVQHAADPAIAIVERLCRQYPAVDATLVVNARPHGTNRKIANLINMFPSARHDVLVVSDSDMHVAPDYLRRVVGVLEQPGTGLVTTIYTGLPASGSVTAQMGAAYINQIFASGALLARFLGRQDCLGATMALTRETLLRIGGFPGLSPYVADDGVLGRRVRALGLHIRLAPTVPATTVTETGIAALFRHELRWARTIRAMAPVGFVMSALQYPVFWACLAAAFARGQSWVWALLAAACLIRMAAGRGTERALGAMPTALALAPLRDLLSVAVMAVAFFDDEVAWRGQVLSTAPDKALVQGGFQNGGEAVYRGAPTVLAHGKG